MQGIVMLEEIINRVREMGYDYIVYSPVIRGSFLIKNPYFNITGTGIITAQYCLFLPDDKSWQPVEMASVNISQPFVTLSTRKVKFSEL